jgi:hypothetical protein
MIRDVTMRDSSRQQFLRATGNKTAALILEYFLVLRDGKCKRFPHEPEESPKLWIDYTQEALAERFLVSVDTVRRAVRALIAKRFCSLEQFGCDRTYRYVLNMKVIESMWDYMPLFEEVAICHAGTMPASNLANCQLPTLHGASLQPSTMPACYPSSSLPSSLPSPSGGFADAEFKILEKEREGLEAQADAQPHALPGQGSSQAEADADREELIAECRAIGISLEQTEHYLASHTRQKLQAALQNLKATCRNRIVRNPGGFVIGFLRNPANYGYELDSQGCWRSSKEIAMEQKRRHAVKARDRPELTDSESRRRAAALAWEALSYDQQQAIKQQIQNEHPDTTPARRHQLSQERALAITEESAPCQRSQ